jgi:soluble lytic murein transglycosylase
MTKRILPLLLLLFATLPCARAQPDASQAERCVRRYAAHYRVPPELIAALIDVESRWNPRAVSDKGAMGLMQLMPATARRFGANHPFDVEENIAAGTRYVTALMWEFHGDMRLVSACVMAVLWKKSAHTAMRRCLRWAPIHALDTVRNVCNGWAIVRNLSSWISSTSRHERTQRYGALKPSPNYWLHRRS